MFRKRVKPIRQVEAHECILACLTMVANYHGHPIRLAELRRNYPDITRGAGLRDMMIIAQSMSLAPRAVRVELESVAGLQLPCIVHWGFSHFVVLETVEADGFTIVDPAIGKLKIGREHFSRFFTGVALELSPVSGELNIVGGELPDEKNKIFNLRNYWRPIGRLVFISSIVLVFSLISPLAVQIVIDEVILKSDPDLLVLIISGFFLAILISAFSTYLQGLHVISRSAISRTSLTNRFLDSLLDHKWSYFVRRNLGALVAQYNSLNYLVSFLVQNIGSLITDLMFVVAVSAILFLIEPRIALIVFLFSMLVVLVRIVFLGHVRRLQNQQVTDQANEEAYFVESMRGIGSVKANRLELERVSGNLDRTTKAVNSSFALSHFALKFGFFIQCVKAVELVIALYLLAQLVMQGKMSIGVMYAFYAYRQFLDQRVTSFVDSIGELLNLRVHLDRVNESYQAKSSVVGQFNVGHFMRFLGSIELRNITYNVDNGRTAVIDNFNASVNKGQFVHISGVTGSGKTTLLRIILNIYVPKNGVVLVDGVEISEKTMPILRNSVGVVMQEDALFKGSILENISLFEDRIDAERVQRLCKLCCVHDEIMKLPLAYQSDVGDLGGNLSTGQRQRILLARSLYRNPSILILDEATANLNSDIERTILRNLKSTNKTVLFASHSPAVADFADASWKIGKTDSVFSN